MIEADVHLYPTVTGHQLRNLSSGYVTSHLVRVIEEVQLCSWAAIRLRNWAIPLLNWSIRYVTGQFYCFLQSYVTGRQLWIAQLSSDPHPVM